MSKVTSGCTLLRSLRNAVFLCFGLAAPTVVRAQQTFTVPSSSYPTIQSAINAAGVGDTVQVTGVQTYTENITIMKDIVVMTTLPAGSAILDGGGRGPVVSITGALAAGATLSGFTIQNGGKPQLTGGPHGGIYVSGTVAHITNNTLVNTFCNGISAVNSVILATGNDISKTLTTGCEAAEGLGSGVAITGTYSPPPSSPPFPVPSSTLSGNKIHGNVSSVAFSADQGGGAAINVSSLPSVVLNGNILSDNSSTGYGGAIYIATTPLATVENNVVYGNTGLSGGLEVVIPTSTLGVPTLLIANNTFAGNNAGTTANGSGIDLIGSLSQVAIVNNILISYGLGDVAVNCATNYETQTLTPPIFDHNDIYAMTGGVTTGGYCPTPSPQVGNISQDPLFVHGTAADINGASGNAVNLSVQAASPAIDAGNNSATAYTATDAAGTPRIKNSTVDMGAYESSNGPAATASSIVTLVPATYIPTSGGSVALTATVTPKTSSTVIPTGPVTFLEDGATVGTAALNGTDTPSTTTFTLNNLTPGLHHLSAQYPGDGTTPSGFSIDVILSATVGLPTQTKTVLSSTANPSTFGQNITFTAHVSSPNGVPTGEVTFTYQASPLGSPIVPIGTSTVDASGDATVSIATLPVNVYTITGMYIPTGAYVTSSGTFDQGVTGLAVTPVLTVSPLMSNVGDTVTLSVKVSPPATTGASVPTGTITFYEGNVIIGTANLVAGMATLTTKTLPAGFDYLGCEYSGNATYGVAECTDVLETVGGVTTTTSLFSLPNPSVLGESVQFVASVIPSSTAGGVPTGTVQFYDGATLLDTEPVLTGQSCSTCPMDEVKAIFTTSTLTVGSHAMSAVYVPTGVLSASTGTETQVVNSALATTLSATPSANPAYALTPFTVNFSLTSANGPLTNTAITYTINGVAQSTLITDANGRAALTLTEPTGMYAIDAKYAPVTPYAGAEGKFTENVLANPTSVTLIANPSPGYQAQNVAILASVLDTTGTASPNGTVTLFDAGSPVATLPTGPSIPGTALISVTFNVNTLTLGDHQLSATFTPADANFLAHSSATQTLTILPLDIALSTSVSSTTIQTEHHGSLTLTATSIGMWSGTLQLTCGPTLPPVLTCTFGQFQLSVPANGTVSTSVDLETDALADFASLHQQPRGSSSRGIIALAVLFPLALFGMMHKRRKLGVSSLCVLLCLLASSCGGKFPAHTPPGTYDIAVTATGTSVGSTTPTTKTIHFTLIVTP